MKYITYILIPNYDDDSSFKCEILRIDINWIDWSRVNWLKQSFKITFYII